MKGWIVLCIVAWTMCDEHHVFHYKTGTIIVDNEPAVPIVGPIFLDFTATSKTAVIAGMHTKGTTHTSFGFASAVNRIANGSNIEIDADCRYAAWGIKTLYPLTGVISIRGTWQKIRFTGVCEDPKTKARWILDATAHKAECPFYLPHEAAQRADVLVGESGEVYKAVHVLNYAIWGFPYIESVNSCQSYLDNFPDANEIKPGYLIVGKDGQHCGIFDREGDKFIHSNPTKKQVTLTPNTMIPDYFKNGYVLKSYNQC
jgi:hypothetical protein